MQAARGTGTFALSNPKSLKQPIVRCMIDGPKPVENAEGEQANVT